MNNKRLISIIMVALLVFSFGGLVAPGPSYGATNNLLTSDWALEEVEDAFFYGFIPTELSGVSLEDSVTREEFASLVVSVWEKETNIIVKLAKDSPFSDTESKNVLKAFQLGIVKGMGNGKYEPKGTLTREAAATMLTRLYLQLTKEEIGIPNALAFQDDDSIHGWAKQSVYYMSDKGLLKGVGANEFNPQGLISREQALVISVRMVKEIFRNILSYAPETDFASGTRVSTIAEVKSAFKYAQYHLIPIITLKMDSGLAGLLESEYSNIMTKREIESISYSYTPGPGTLIVTIKYSLMAEVLALIVNDEVKLSRVSNRALEIQSQVLGIRNSIITPRMDYHQREKAIHDYIVKNYSYDVDNNCGGMKYEDSYSLSGLLKNGQGVCQAYAQLFWALCLNTKIPAGIVYGYAGGGSHAWNIVNIYGDCFHVDVTWDDPIPDQGQKVRYDYYNLSEQAIKRDHQIYDINNSPCDFVTNNH